jgi:hypothetical protein
MQLQVLLRVWLACEFAAVSMRSSGTLVELLYVHRRSMVCVH